MKRVPLLGHAGLDEVFAWRPSGPVAIRHFLAEATALAACLPPGRHLLNVCQDRYHFAVGLAAGLLSGRISLQPSSHSPETLRQIHAACPDVCCLCDSEFASGDLRDPLLARLVEGSRAFLSSRAYLWIMRILGLLYVTNKHKFGWFGH